MYYSLVKPKPNCHYEPNFIPSRGALHGRLDTCGQSHPRSSQSCVALCYPISELQFSSIRSIPSPPVFEHLLQQARLWNYCQNGMLFREHGGESSDKLMPVIQSVDPRTESDAFGEIQVSDIYVSMASRRAKGFFNRSPATSTGVRKPSGKPTRRIEKSKTREKELDR